MLTRRLTCHLRAEMLCKMLPALIWQLCISLPARLAPLATPHTLLGLSPQMPDESEYKINICPPYMFVTYRLAPCSSSHIYFNFYFCMFPVFLFEIMLLVVEDILWFYAWQNIKYYYKVCSGETNEVVFQISQSFSQIL